MSVALNPECPPDLRHLIVADIAPSKGPLSREFSGYVEALKKIEASRVSSRQAAQDILRPYEQVRLPRPAAALPPLTGGGSCLELGPNGGAGRDDARVFADESEAPGP